MLSRFWNTAEQRYATADEMKYLRVNAEGGEFKELVINIILFLFRVLLIITYPISYPLLTFVVYLSFRDIEKQKAESSEKRKENYTNLYPTGTLENKYPDDTL